MTELTEKDLEREVTELCMAELRVLDRKLEQIPERPVSPRFQRKMKRLFFLRKIRYDVLFNTVGKKVAAVILCLLIAGTTTVMSVEALREKLFKILTGSGEPPFTVSFMPTHSTYSPPEAFSEYSITEVPEGFVLESGDIDRARYFKVQHFIKEEMNIHFGQMLAQNATLSVYMGDAETETREYRGREYVCFSQEGAQFAVWTEEDYAFFIYSELPMEQVLEIAASVKE